VLANLILGQQYVCLPGRLIHQSYNSLVRQYD
jgi:hypothetical protein